MHNSKKDSVRFFIQFALLAAIEAVFCFTPLGSLPAIGPIVATLAMIPVIITSILLGTKAGTLMGAKVHGGMSGSNTLVNLETPEKKQLYAYVRGTRSELTPGAQLSNVKLTTRKQDTVIFYVLESYEVYLAGQQAA